MGKITSNDLQLQNANVHRIWNGIVLCKNKLEALSILNDFYILFMHIGILVKIEIQKNQLREVS